VQDGTGQLLLDQQPRAAPVADGAAAGPGKAAARSGRDNHVGLAVEAGCPVPFRQWRGLVGAEQELAVLGYTARHGGHENAPGPAGQVKRAAGSPSASREPLTPEPQPSYRSATPAPPLRAVRPRLHWPLSRPRDPRRWATPGVPRAGHSGRVRSHMAEPALRRPEKNLARRGARPPETGHW
jgi:hypothetical protein